MNQRMKNIYKWVASIFLLISFSGLAAEKEVSLTAGLWLGDRTPEMETRMFLDDLIEPFNSRINMPWSGGYSATLYPLSIQYKQPIWKGKAVVTGSVMRNLFNYEFDGFILNGGNGAISMVELSGYEENNIDLDLGYELTFGGKFFITPFIGTRYHTKKFELSEITIGSPSGLSLEGDFSGVSRSIYAGVHGKYQIVKSWSVFGDVRKTMPVLGNIQGNMEFNSMRFYTNNTIKWEKVNANYNIDLTRATLGGQYDMSESLHFFAGVMQETMKVHYPEYKSIPINVNLNAGSLAFAGSVYEYFTDQFFIYKQPIETKKGIVFAGITYDINL